MEAKELRVGNTVLISKSECKVDGIYEDFIYVNHYSGNVMKFISDIVEPIPLTEEWLLLFGFNKVRDYPVFRLSSIQVEYNGSDNLWRVNLYADSTVVKSVHQLQNLFFALKGEELTIKQIA